LSKGRTITSAEFPPELASTAPSEGRTLEALEKRHIARVLEETEGNIVRTAKILGIHRMTLYNKLKKYGISANELDT
jgi:transcriptional regulator of acetoin/glycerol metabolism